MTLGCGETTEAVVAPTTIAFSEIYAASRVGSAGNRPPIKWVMRNCYDAPGNKALSKELDGDQDGRTRRGPPQIRFRLTAARSSPVSASGTR